MLSARPAAAEEIQPPGLPPLPTDLDAGPSAPGSIAAPVAPAAAASRSGLSTFLTRWRMNDLLFLFVNENLDPSRPQAQQPWFAVVPDGWRLRIVSPLMSSLDQTASAAAFMLTRLLSLSACGLLVAAFCWKLLCPAQETARQPEAAGQLRWLEFCFLTLAWFWLVAPTQNPWYGIWCLPLIPFTRSRAWLWVSGLTLVYYLRFWLNAHWPEPPGPLGSRYDGASFFDFVVVWFEFLPLYVGLLVSFFFRSNRQQ
jgi:hypothetical protein